MSTTPRTRRFLFLIGPLIVVLVGGALSFLGIGAPAAASDEVHVATSVCEAHELKAKAALDPRFKIEIPAEFNQPFPSREACLSHAAAEDEDAPGPLQPIQFSHKHHSGTYKIHCLYCHTGSDRSQAAGVPAVEVCMGCHLQFAPAYDELAGIRTLKAHWERKEPILWKQIHRSPEHVQFRHNRHSEKVQVQCQDCHGPVEELVVAVGTADGQARDGLVHPVPSAEVRFTGLQHVPLLGTPGGRGPWGWDGCLRSIEEIF
jgi:hypothetical protein